MSAAAFDGPGSDLGQVPAVFRDEDRPGREPCHDPASVIDRGEGRRGVGDAITETARHPYPGA